MCSDIIVQKLLLPWKPSGWVLAFLTKAGAVWMNQYILYLKSIISEFMLEEKDQMVIEGNTHLEESLYSIKLHGRIA